MWGKYGLWGSLGIAIAVFAWSFIKWVAANPEKAERIYGWFRQQNKKKTQAACPGNNFDKSSIAEDPIVMPNASHKQNYAWTRAIKAAASHYAELNPGLWIIVKRLEVLGENARVEIYLQQKIIGQTQKSFQQKRYRPSNATTKRTTLIIDKTGDILSIK